MSRFTTRSQELNFLLDSISEKRAAAEGHIAALNEREAELREELRDIEELAGVSNEES